MYPGMGESLQFRGVERHDVASPQLEPLSTSDDPVGGRSEGGGVLGHEQPPRQFVLDPASPFLDSHRGILRKIGQLVGYGQHRSTPFGAKAGK
jgi:hypothetical protein